MQTLKTDIEQRILEVAHQEFIENGVQRTCIRNVARKAGVTVGNLYHYFDSKDALFCEVMRPLLTALDRYILSHNDEERLSLDVFELRQQHIDYMFSMFAIVKEFRPELRLLLFNAEGTSLEGYKNKVIDHQMQVGVEYLRLMKERYPHLNINISPFLLHLTCSSWMTLFCELVEHEDYSEEEIKLALRQYANYGIAGWKELMKP
ncbi:MAG: TetR/AcrR family transcriptional regulator [Phocaeicola sp.]|uniref:TetR/AcrR family transcriptional regulator n=1 Tax=Phocaeicola TaxID=909656 RepID=UPI00234E93B2|nr:TetR/AcrR family transcriptional regulator [Phocaeicola oris]MCE2615820.1 TetR/AcrR family transcriptional regulator [Phocaeicola oris]